MPPMTWRMRLAAPALSSRSRTARCRQSTSPAQSNYPAALWGIGRVPVRKAIQAGARTVDALLEIYAVREGLDHESQRFCYRGWLAERDGANPKQRTRAE